MSPWAEPRESLEKQGGKQEGMWIPWVPGEFWEHMHRRQAWGGRPYFSQLFKRMDCSVQWLLLCYVKTLFTDCLNYNRVYSFCQAGKVATGEEEGRKIRKTTWEKNFSKIIPPPMCITWGIFLCKVVLGSLKPFELPSATSRLLD